MSLSICHVIQSLDLKSGGPPVIAWNLARAQRRRGHAVSICRTIGNGDAFTAGDLSACGCTEDLQFINVKRPGSIEALLGAGPTRRELAGPIRQADIVHLHGVWDPVLLLAANESRAQARPYFVLLNGMLDPWSMRQKRMKKQLALALAYRALLEGAARIHFGNRDEQRLIQPLGLRVKGVIIPNGIDLDEVDSPPPGTFRKRFPVLGDYPFVLFLARLHVKKGLNFLADAFAAISCRHANVRLVVAGPDGRAQADFEQQIARLGLSHRVLITGPLYGPEKQAALAEAACLCLPSHQEGFSVALLEALAHRLPVVVSEHCHFPEVAEHGAGFVVPLNSQAIASALDRLLGNAQLRADMGARGRDLVENCFTWDKVAEQCDRAYEEVLSCGSATAV